MRDEEAQPKALVYLSYAPQDEQVAIALGRSLRNLGLGYFPDPESREPDSFEWSSISVRNIHDCAYFALIYSESANASPTVQKELRSAERAPRRGWMLLDRSTPQPVFLFRLGAVNACPAYDGNGQENIDRFAHSIWKRLQTGREYDEPTKPQVFLSYSHQDEAAARVLCKELKDCGLSYFLSSESIDVGTETWERRIAQAIRDCRYFVVLHSSAANRSDWVSRELLYSQYVRRDWIRLDQSSPDPKFELQLGREPCLAFSGDRDRKLREFARKIGHALSSAEDDGLVPGRLNPNENPYLGHESYGAGDSGRLLGRDSDIGRIAHAVYESVYRAPNASQPTHKRLFLVYGPSGTGKSSLVTAGVLPALRSRFKIIGPIRPRALERDLEEYATEAGQAPCIIALDQFEEIWPDMDKSMSEDISKKLGDINALFEHHQNLVVMISFRSEYLWKIQDAYENVQSYWNPQIVRGLTEEAAKVCISGPARDVGVNYDDDVLNAVSNALLTAEDQRTADGDRVTYVEPVELQLVCSELWKRLQKNISKIDRTHLYAALEAMLKGVDPKSLARVEAKKNDLGFIANEFVTHAIEGFLAGAIEKISLSKAADDCRYNKVERINFALLQFISEGNKRVQLKINWEGGTQWVGRLPVTIVNELESQHLLRRMYVRGEYEFELMHDRMVAPIASQKEHLGLLYSVNSLDSAMTKVKNDPKRSSELIPVQPARSEEVKEEANPFQGWFESYEPLIKDLDSFKDFEGLRAEEAEFVLRSALAYDKDKEAELKGWAKTVAKQHPSRLRIVLRDAFTLRQPAMSEAAIISSLYKRVSHEVGRSKEAEYHRQKQAAAKTAARVRINAAILLRQEWLQASLGTTCLSEMLFKVREACEHASAKLDETMPQAETEGEAGSAAQNGAESHQPKELEDPNAELEELCHTLVSCPIEYADELSNCAHLDAVSFKRDGRSRTSRRILLWMRDKANMREPSCFVRYWKALPGFQRTMLTIRLFWLRMWHTGFRILCISLVGAIVTGAGAAAVYAVCASLGASFTQNSTAKGFTQGLFHGFAGGVTWGLTLSLSTLIYWLIVRGRRIEPELKSHWAGGILFSGLAGLVGGIFIACMVLSVDDSSGLRSAGWLTTKNYHDHPYLDAFGNTHAGLIFPIYGLFLGLGVGWSMLSIHHDAAIKQWMSDEKNAEKTITFFRSWAWTVLKKAFTKSVPYTIGMVLAGISVIFLFQTGHMDCGPKQDPVLARCEVYNRYHPLDSYLNESDLAPVKHLELRALGTSLIIYSGAFSLTVGYLLALFAIRFGVEIPEDKNFAPLKESGRRQQSVSFAQDPQRVPDSRQTVPG